MKRHLLLLLVALLPMLANAYKAEIDGIYYNFSENEATVTYSEEWGNSYSGIVVIPKSVSYKNKTYNVTCIGEYAFRNCSGLTSVTIPNSVTSIDHEAFQGCNSLTSITIPNSVTIISWGVFSGCGLTSIKVEEGNSNYDSRDNCNAIIHTVSNSLVYGCQNTIIPQSVTSIGAFAFEGCGLTSITIPDNVTYIDYRAFAGCSLTSVTIGNSVTSICVEAFSGCSSLTSITIPNSVTSIDDYAFSFCSGLTSVIIPNSVTSIGNQAFSGCSGLTSVIIPNSVTSIGNQAFSGCSCLTSVTLDNNEIVSRPKGYGSSIKDIFGDQVKEYVIGNTVKTIGERTFADCTSLTSVTIGNSVTSIGMEAFSRCSSLTSITIGNSVTSIGENAFGGCSGLTSLTFHCKEIGSWFNCNSLIKEVIIGDEVTSIGDNAFAMCDGLTSITIPNSVTSIGSYAFQKTYKLTSIEIPKGVMTINEGTFFDCFSLTSITIPNSVTSIGNSAFSGCGSLTSITIGNSVTQIGSYAFSGCNSLTSVFAKMETPVSIEDYTFTNCSNATLYVQASSVTKYKNANYWKDFKKIVGIPKINGVFYKPDNVTKEAEVIPPFDDGKYEGDKVIPSTITYSGITYHVTSIGDKAFEGCTDLTSITIPESITSIGNRVFSGCSGLGAIVVEQDNPKYDSRNDCNAIIETGSNRLIYGCKNTSIPNNVTSIGDYAFDTYSSLHSLTISVGVLSIGKNAFYDTFPKKVIWLTNTPPDGYLNVNGIENYVANERYTDLKNATVYPFLSSTFIVDGIKYVPVSPSERTCDAIDCIYNESAENINISDTVINRNILLNVKQVKPYLCYGNTFIKEVNYSAQCGVATYAFSRCTALKTVELGEGISSIGNEAFSNCSSLDSIAIPNSATYLGSHAFENCSAMILAKIGNSITLIPDSTFRGCSSLTDIQIGTGVQTISTYAFSDCASLPTIQIPQNVTTIDNYVFNGCTGLKKVLMDDGEVELGLGSNGNNPLFADCPLDSVYIGRNISYSSDSEKGYSPFYRNTTLRSVAITDEETEISKNEFYGCTNLKDVKIGDGVTTIGDNAFSGCVSLEAFSFGFSVETIGQEAFSDCIAMATLVSKAETPPVCGAQALDDINKWECTLLVPVGFVEAYQAAPQWREFFFVDIDPDGINEIKEESLTPALSEGEGEWYDLNGRKILNGQSSMVNGKMPKGINIIRYSDGTSKKVLIK